MINKIYKTIYNKYSRFFRFIFFLRYLIGLFIVAIILFSSIPNFYNLEKRSKFLKEYLTNNYDLKISKYDVSVKRDSKDEINSFAKAHIEVDGKEIICEGSGNGPVNALDNAIRSNVDKVGKYSKYLRDLKLVDYKVRILNTGTNATTRVSIESTDKNGKNWFTIGVSPNIIDASFKALIDSLDYKLYKEKAPAND